MDELSALAGSERYEVCADDAQGVQPLVRSSATHKDDCLGRHPGSTGRTTGQLTLPRIEVRPYLRQGISASPVLQNLPRSIAAYITSSVLLLDF